MSDWRVFAVFSLAFVALLAYGNYHLTVMHEQAHLQNCKYFGGKAINYTIHEYGLNGGKAFCDTEGMTSEDYRFKAMTDGILDEVGYQQSTVFVLFVLVSFLLFLSFVFVKPAWAD